MSNSVLGKKKSSNAQSFGSYAVLVVTLACMTFFGVCNPQSFQDGLSGIAGSVDGMEITNSEFSRAYRAQESRLRQQYGESYDSREVKLAQITFESLIRDRVLYLEAEKLGLRASDVEVAKSLSEQINFNDEHGKFSEEKFQQILRANGLTEAALMDDQRRYLTVEKLRQFIMQTAFISTPSARLDDELNETKMDVDYLKFDPNQAHITFSPEEIAAAIAKPGSEDKIKGYYESHVSEYRKLEEVRARHILISYKGAQSAGATITRSKEEAQKIALEVLKEVKAAGANFAAIAKAKTDEPSGKQSGGDLGYFSRDSMTKEFSDVAFVLKKGQISDVVATPFGFHIIEVLDHKPAVNTSLADARQEIIQKLLKREKGPELTQQNASKALALLDKPAELSQFLAEQKVQWQKTGPFQVGARYIPGIGTSSELSDILFTLDLKTKPVCDKVVKVERSYYIIRLLSVTKPKEQDLTDEKVKQIAQSAKFSEAYTTYSEFETESIKEFESKNLIHRNPKYLALDQRENNEGTN